MKIVLKGVPPSLNQTSGRQNPWSYRSNKRAWTEAVQLACKAAPGRPVAPYTKALVRIDYYFSSARRHDADNYSGKYLLDGLTRAGVIADDDLAHISTAIHGHVDRQRPRTEITVIALGGEEGC